MDSPYVVLLVILGTTAILCGGLAVTLRTLKAGAARAAEEDAVSRHDRATTELLKRYFDGKDCAICKQPIPPVQRTGLKPGLLHSATREVRSWDEIPDGGVSSALENQLPLCSECRIAETFRRRFPDRAVDRDPSIRNAHQL